MVDSNLTSAKNPRRSSANPAIDATPIVRLETPRQVHTGGRPKKLPPMPYMPGMSDQEREMFDGFINEYLEQYPDLTPTDYRILHLAAVEYIKYARVAAKELETGVVIAMSRQHPAVNMRALLDQLSVTRKARTAKGKPEDETEEELKNYFLSIGKSSNQSINRAFSTRAPAAQESSSRASRRQDSDA